MSDEIEAKDEKSQGGILKKGADAAKNLRDIAEIISSAWAAIAQKVRPDYAAAAKGFQLIAKDVAGYARNLVEFLAPYYYLSFYGDEQVVRDKFNDLAIKFRSRDPWDWISQIKFRCSEIDHLYRTYCNSWISNIYGKHVAAQKQAEAETALQELTSSDLSIVDGLTSQAMDPLKDFIDRADEMFRRGGEVSQVESLHKTFRREIRPVIDDAERMITDLDTAVRLFQEVADSSSRSSGTDHNKT